MKYITLFETAAAYNAATLDLPNVSLIEENMSVDYKPWVEPSFFCKLTLNDDSIVELEDSGELTSAIIQDYKSTLVSAEIGELCTSIGISAFANCSNLTTIVIPDSVTSIGGSAFYGTNALKVLNYNAKCELSNSFRDGWLNLETVIIGNSTPSISSGAFSGCTELTNVTIGNSVTSIGSGAFATCGGLTNIVSNAMTAPTIQSNTFKDVKTGGTLTVLSSSTGYDTWMSTDDNYLGKYNWTKVEQ